MRLSIAVMYHPRRSANLDRLVRSCGPLGAHLVADPDPAGPPSALRTAKAAWAAVPEDSTHHLVLQDDVRLADGFAVTLQHIAATGPRAAIACYVNWNSPQNSYLVRRATAAGSPWAPLSPFEYTPTLGLMLPAPEARALADHLRSFPDELRDDDELVRDFCRDRGITVLATVPHLVEHLNQPSVAGNEAHGLRCGVVFDESPPPVRHWSTPVDGELVRRAAGGRAREFALEFHDSRCLIRFVRAAHGEPVENAFGWDWLDWAPAIGIDPGSVLDGLAAHLRAHPSSVSALPAVPGHTITEYWAAAYLLGADVADLVAGDTLDPVRADLRRRALASWLDSGLRSQDQRLIEPDGREALVDLAVAAVRYGAGARPVRATRPDEDLHHA